MRDTCSVDGCERPRKTRGLCQTHYVRLWRSGSTGSADIKTHRVGGPCAVEGCTRTVRTRQLCARHYKRWLRYGDPTSGGLELGSPEVGYIGAQHRVVAARGKATEHACAACAGPAQVWAYVGEDSAERRTDPVGRPYSGNPADYAPMCRSCQAKVTSARRVRGVGCKAVDCARPHFGQGLCSMHYKRAWKAGMAPKIALRGSREIAYETAHSRVKQVHGSASERCCSLCGDRARDWAYLHVGADEDRIEDESGRIYSLNIDRYAAMCVSCHRRYDALMVVP